jgi:hypothetical protein
LDRKFQKIINEGLKNAVRHYWKTRTKQRTKQGSTTGTKDAGNRSAVTGGAQLDGFVVLVRDLLLAAGVKDACVFTRKSDTCVPGFYRPAKNWDLVAIVGQTLLATIEFKSQAGPSYGNNFNNRVEEALGSATDFWKAYEKGVFKPSSRPFLGYLFLLEDDTGSREHVRARSAHFDILPEFSESSYTKRYQIFCERLVRERLYDAACFLTATKKDGLKGIYVEPGIELTFNRFAAELIARAKAIELSQ